MASSRRTCSDGSSSVSLCSADPSLSRSAFDWGSIATEKLGESNSAASRAAVLEFVLEGLHRGKRLNKTEMDGTAVYGG